MSMPGMEGATMLLAGVLEARVPGALAQIRADRALEVADLPDPKLYAATDRSRLEPAQWPAVLVVGQDTTAVRPAAPVRSVGDGAGLLGHTDAEAWTFTYRIRVYVWARNHSPSRKATAHSPGVDRFERVGLLRDRLAVAVRYALLAQPTLDARARVRPLSVRESYSDVATDDQKAAIAGAFVACDVDVDEHVSAGSLGQANTIAVGVTPAHPALD